MNPPLASYPCPLCAASTAHTCFTFGVFRIVKCRSCGMIYVNPRIRNEELFAIYRDGYFDRGGYKDYELIAPLRIKTFRQWYNVFKKYLPADYSDALDIGCAAGYFLDLLKQEGWRQCEGIELDARMVTGLRNRSYMVSDVPLEHFVPSKRYHLITLFDVLEHLPDINVDFGKLYGMLADKGIVALVTPNYASMQRRLFGKRWFQFKPREHIYYFTPRTLRLLAEKFGFSLVHLSRSGHYADVNFLHSRFVQYRFSMLDKLVRRAAAIAHLEKKSWYVDTASMLVVLKKNND